MSVHRVLFIAPYVPGPIRVRSHEVIRALVHRGHEVTVATPVTSVADQEDVASLRGRGIRVESVRLGGLHAAWNGVRAITARQPVQSVFSHAPALEGRIVAAIETGSFDVVHVEHVRGARYGLAALRCQTRRPVIWDGVDAISHLFSQTARLAPSWRWRMTARLELGPTRRLEADLVGRFDDVLVVSEVDRRALAALRPDLGSSISDRLHVVPNGVDLERFSPASSRARDTARDLAGGDPEHADDVGVDIVFTGKMSYHANVAAALHLVNDIMPCVWRTRPGSTLAIVGQRPPAVIRGLEAHPENRVRVTGRVPDMRPHIRGARIAVAPIQYGAGIQNKVLEALACGVPVVASPVAVAGLGVTPHGSASPESCGVVEAGDAEGFARAILDLLEDDARRARLGERGRAYVERNHDWDGVAARLDAIYTNAIDRVATRSQGRREPLVPRVARRPAKIALDYALTLPALVLLLPLLVLLGLLVRLGSPGPALHRRRVLRAGGGTFDAYKLRTMYENGDEILSRHPGLAEELAARHKIRQDPRVTPTGRWLRRLSLDELPQLLNVVRGDMSLVGPRMISPEELARYGTAARQLLSVKPGITGLWQVSGRSDLSYDERVRLDREYVECYSFARDLRILFLQTVPAVLRRRGAY